MLKEQFPDYEVDTIDVSRLVRQRPDLVLINSIVTVLLYRKDITLGRKKFRLAFWRTPFIFRQVKRLVQKRIVDGNYSFTFQIQSLFDASTPGIPHFVYTDHTHLENQHYAGFQSLNLYSPRWIELEKQIYRNATQTYVLSSNVRRSLIEEYGCSPEKAVLVFTGSNARVSPIKTSNIDYTQPNILFVGLDWKRKGGPDLVKAFRLVLEKCPSAKLRIVGANPSLEVPNCEVVGKVPSHELDRYYQQASVFCLPTYAEPFGIVFIEAMAAHLPIVATHVGAIPDFVEAGRNGFLVNPGDIPGLASALLELVTNPDRCRTFGEYSFQLARERYSWEVVGDRIRQGIVQSLGEPLPARQPEGLNVQERRYSHNG